MADPRWLRCQLLCGGGAEVSVADDTWAEMKRTAAHTRQRGISRFDGGGAMKNGSESCAAYAIIFISCASEIPTKGSSKRSKNLRMNVAYSRTDPSWEHGYDVVDNSRKVKCKYCDKIVNGGIFHFKHHLACSQRDAEACISVPDDVKKKMLSLVCKIAQASKTKKRIICSNEDSSYSGEELQASKKRKGKAIIGEFVKVKKDSSQATVNQFMKKDIREEVCQQFAKFFYTSDIPFNCSKNPEFAKMFEIDWKYGCGFNLPSYHELRETFLKKEVDRTMTLLEEHRFMWKKGYSIMSDGWIDMKRQSICNFLVNSEKEMIFLQSTNTSDISKTTDKVCKMNPVDPTIENEVPLSNVNHEVPQISEVNNEVPQDQPNMTPVVADASPSTDASPSAIGTRNLTSDVWNHFRRKKINGMDKAICNYCEKPLSDNSKHGTTHLLEHFKICPR
ncbi:hypothetical protein ZIOFF_056208 [Zingiber officinale]|uniref:BED-type domain-containing protein n=1 Tax=Zingiber officinale TaxID=94328 RepID=A0A8J5FNC2_ZINOF|nr:hypothetical protein ZIOFF_056208 [Zingiber officinale]